MTQELTSNTRTIDGREAPIAGTWTIDPAHSRAEFVARHLMVTKVRGSFPEISGTATIAEDPADSKVEVTLGVASVTTGSEDRDNHLTSGEFFDAATYPSITFRSTAVRPAGDRWKLAGDLTIRDTTRPVELDLDFDGAATDPWGQVKAAFSATTTVDRTDWGLVWNVPLDGGGVLVGEKVKLEIEAQISLQA